MKLSIRMICALLTATVLMTCFTSAVCASTVTFDGGSDKFIFSPGSDKSPTDLFTEFKNVMPGDKLIQPITVKNDADDDVKVKIYMRSLGADEASMELLSQLRLSLAKADENEMAYMFDTATDGWNASSEWILLGTLYSGGEVNLEVKLEVPIELDNSFKNSIGTIDWQFKAEELPAEPDDPQPPDTGDSNDVSLYVWVMAASAVVLIVLVVLILRRKKSNNI